MAVSFYLFTRPDKQGEYPIRVSVMIRGTRLISTVGFNIAADKWVASRKDENGEEIPIQRVKKGCNNAKGIPYNIINLRLNDIANHFERYEMSLEHRPSVDDLADQLAIVKGGDRRKKARAGEIAVADESPSIIKYFDQFVREESRLNQWTVGTMQCWNAFRSHLLAQGRNLKFSDFSEEGIQKFVTYLRSKRKMEEKTVQKHYSNLRWFLNWCIRKGYCQESEISKYRPKFKVLEKPVIFLTREELEKLYFFEIPKNGTKVELINLKGEKYEKVVNNSSSLEKTRDLFCFCAFTSLRYSDMAALKKTDRVGNTLYVTSQKTNDKLVIELNEYSAAILDKYKDTEFPDGLALPVISNQKENDYIKDLGQLCEFNDPITRTSYKAGQRVEETQMKWELLGTHAARRTFICYALGVGIPPQVVMKWTGHNDYKSMRPYIAIAESTAAEAMKLFNGKLTDNGK